MLSLVNIEVGANCIRRHRLMRGRKRRRSRMRMRMSGVADGIVADSPRGHSVRETVWERM